MWFRQQIEQPVRATSSTSSIDDPTTVSIDLGELGGFNYESGIVFAAFAEGASDAVARGGRYDQIGKAFGRARPATGFSMDLKSLLPLIADHSSRGAILAPREIDRAVKATIAQLRGHHKAPDQRGLQRGAVHNIRMDDRGLGSMLRRVVRRLKEQGS